MGRIPFSSCVSSLGPSVAYVSRVPVSGSLAASGSVRAVSFPSVPSLGREVLLGVALEPADPPITSPLGSVPPQAGRVSVRCAAQTLSSVSDGLWIYSSCARIPALPRDSGKAPNCSVPQFLVCEAGVPVPTAWGCGEELLRRSTQAPSAVSGGRSALT